MAQYRTKDGDMIDRICFHYYDGVQSGAVEMVYEANRGLAEYGASLPSGLVIELPELPAPENTPATVKLWD